MPLPASYVDRTRVPQRTRHQKFSLTSRVNQKREARNERNKRKKKRRLPERPTDRPTDAQQVGQVHSPHAHSKKHNGVTRRRTKKKVLINRSVTSECASQVYFSQTRCEGTTNSANSIGPTGTRAVTGVGNLQAAKTRHLGQLRGAARHGRHSTLAGEERTRFSGMPEVPQRTRTTREEMKSQEEEVEEAGTFFERSPSMVVSNNPNPSKQPKIKLARWFGRLVCSHNYKKKRRKQKPETHVSIHLAIETSARWGSCFPIY